MVNRNWYVKAPLSWLDDIKIAKLNDKDWRDFVTNYIYTAERFYVTDEMRYEFEKIRDQVKPHLMEKSNGVCTYCGSSDHLEIDHIRPLIKGGTNDINNLQILCRFCNRSKGGKYE